MNAHFTIKTFPEICEKWLESKRCSVNDNTYINYSGILNNYAIPFFKKSDFNFSADLLKNYLAFLREKGITERTINMHFQILKNVMLPEDPIIASIFYEIRDEFQKHTNKKSKTVLTAQENKRLEHYLLTDINFMKLGVYLSHKLKMSSGMICALKWSDIDLEKRKIYITRVVMRDSVAQRSPNRPKTALVERDYRYHNGMKIITIPKKLAEIIENMMPENKNVYVLTNTSRFTEPRNYGYFVSRCYNDCDIQRQ